MSAIFGFLNRDERPASQSDLDAIGGAMAAYGPDGRQTWLHSNVGLGQNQMCFTPEDAFDRKVPEDVDGHRAIVGDVRIDNRPELISELGIPADAARETSDLALILGSWARWGASCMRHFCGAFAFALYDRREQKLFLARSPMGERSLFYYERPGLFAFASSPRGLFALPGVPREINQESIADFIAWVPKEPGSSFFSGINGLQPGDLLLAGREATKLVARRQLEPPPERRYARDTDYLEEFDHLFRRVVADYSRSASPVGVLMSGGLDSASIGATAAKNLALEGKRLHTFTSVPPPGFSGRVPKRRYADETPFVMAIASMHDNIDPHFIHSEGHFYLDELDAFFAATEAPTRSLSNLPWLDAICRHASGRDVRVLLTGMQGNLTISWDGRQLLQNLLRQGKWLAAVREARAVSVSNREQSFGRLLAGQGLLPLLPQRMGLLVSQIRDGKLFAASERSVLHNNSPVLPEFAATHKVLDRAREKGFDFRYSASDPASRARHLIQTADQRSNGHRYPEGRFGIQYRDPSGDIRLAEFCLSIPEDQCMRDGARRSLIRRAMADRLPATIIQSEQRGLQAPDWFDSLLASRGRVADELARIEQSSLARNALDLPRLRRLVEEIPDAKRKELPDISNFRDFLERGIAIGSFLAWFESGGSNLPSMR